MIKKIYGVCFSPAGKTAKIVKTVIEKLSDILEVPCQYISITTPESREYLFEFDEDDFVVAGTPTYAGRVPNKIMPYITGNIKGKGTMGAALVTYGNRNFDDALIELTGIMKNNGFKILGGGTFVAEHSFAETLAKGRPCEEDFIKAEELAEEICRKITAGHLQEPVIPGNPLYDSYYVPKGTDGQPAKFLKARPETDYTKCTMCGKCEEVCPMGSIHAADRYNVTGVCIKCQACIKACPAEAKKFTDPAFLSHREMLKKNFAETHKESEIYL